VAQTRPTIVRPSAHARRALAFAALTALVLATAACRPPGERASSAAAADVDRVSVELLTQPARVGPAVLEVVVRRDGRPVDDAAVRIVGDMTHAGMVPVVADAVGVGAGAYRSEGFAFSMAGDWIITADVDHPDGARDQGALALSVAR
jgi:hypothetical protein